MIKRSDYPVHIEPSGLVVIIHRLPSVAPPHFPPNGLPRLSRRGQHVRSGGHQRLRLFAVECMAAIDRLLVRQRSSRRSSSSAVDVDAFGLISSSSASHCILCGIGNGRDADLAFILGFCIESHGLHLRKHLAQVCDLF